MLPPRQEQTCKPLATAGGLAIGAKRTRFLRFRTRLGLVDEYHCFVHPVDSVGAAWFDQIEDQRDLELMNATACEGGVVGLVYCKPTSG